MKIKKYLSRWVNEGLISADQEHKILEFEDALATVDLKPEEISLIIHTHLHNDHCENDYKCRNAEVIVQKIEYDFLKDPHPVDHRYYPDILDEVNVVEVDGDAHIADGIDVILSPGHTVGGHINLADAYDSIQKIKSMADVLLPLHDLSIGKRKTIP